MTDDDRLIAAQDERIVRRKRALVKRKQEAGPLDERGLRKLVKQAQRRRAKLVKDQARRAGKEKKKEPV